MSKDDAKLVAIVSYVTFIGWIIALILNSNKKTKLGSYHLRQTLTLYIAMVIVGWIPLIGWIVALVGFVFWIMGLISAINGQMKPIPLIGEPSQKWFKGL